MTALRIALEPTLQGLRSPEDVLVEQMDRRLQPAVEPVMQGHQAPVHHLAEQELPAPIRGVGEDPAVTQVSASDHPRQLLGWRSQLAGGANPEPAPEQHGTIPSAQEPGQRQR